MVLQITAIQIKIKDHSFTKTKFHLVKEELWDWRCNSVVRVFFLECTGGLDSIPSKEKKKKKKEKALVSFAPLKPKHLTRKIQLIVLEVQSM